MRIAHIITRMIIGGAQENTLLNCRDLIEQHGDEVLLITGPALGPEGDLLAQAPDFPVPVKLLPSLQRSIHPIRDWQAYREIRQALQAFHPDVVHTHSAKAGILGRCAAWSLSIPAIVHTVHGAPFHPYQSSWARWAFQSCERFAAKRCHAMISVAQAMTDLLVNAKVAPRERFVTISSGMNTEPFLHANEHRERMRAQLGYESHHLVIGKLARLSPLKGHADLLAAFGDLARQQPHARLLLLGEGDLHSTLERQVAAAGLREKVHFAGLIPPGDVPAYLGAIDLLVHTSYREGLARALPQALLAGKPVISYDIDGAREVCLSGKTGLLIPPGDVAGLYQAMLRLATDAALRESFGAEGRELCAEQFAHLATTRRIRQVYAELLGNSGVK